MLQHESVCWTDSAWEHLVSLLPFPGPDVEIDVLDGEHSMPGAVSPLWHAVHNGHVHLAHYLCEQGADVNIKYGSTARMSRECPPVMLAAAQERPACLQV